MVADEAIQHVVLLILENHSFDQMLGCLQDTYPALDGVDVNSPSPRFNLDLSGNKVYQIPTDEVQVALDPKHELRFVLEQLADRNSGFVMNYQKEVKGTTTKARQNIMGYYPLGFLPALHELGRQFTVCDHWFSSLPGPTWPNRFFALSGTSSGRVLMPEGLLHLRLNEAFVQDQPTLFDRLREAGKSWKVYYYDFPSSLLLNRQRRLDNLAGYSRIQNFYAAATGAADMFPSFVFVEPKYFGADQNDDHPPHNIFKAEKLIADVYNALRSNRELWESTLLVVVYDEHGGFYDHLEPPAAIPPDGHREEWTFERLGVRVPALLVSPWVGARVEQTVFDHTSLLKYLIDKWHLGPLGQRTSEANSIGVALDQTTPREGTVPFIRVPYTDLIPRDPELEQYGESNHQLALHAFATSLAEAEESTLAGLVGELTQVAGLWVRMKGWFGAALRRIGKWLSRDYQRITQNRTDAARRVASHLIESSSAPLKPTAQGGFAP